VADFVGLEDKKVALVNRSTF